MRYEADLLLFEFFNLPLEAVIFFSLCSACSRSSLTDSSSLSSTTLTPLVIGSAEASAIVLSLISACEATAPGRLDPNLPFPFAIIFTGPEIREERRIRL
jgi:hypothetical protein